MGKRGGIELVSISFPMRQMAAHDREKTIVVITRDQVSHLVDHDVFETLAGFLGQFEVQPYPAGFWVAGAPLRLHSPDSPFRNLQAENRLPFREKRRD